MQDKMINKYIAKNHSGSVFTDNELQVIKDGNIDDMVTTFLDMNTEYYNKQMQSVLKVFTQFMSTEIELERIIYQKEFDGKFVGCQIMDGDIDVFLGIAGEDADLLCVASTFSQEDMNKFDAELSRICTINNINKLAYCIISISIKLIHIFLGKCR